MNAIRSTAVFAIVFLFGSVQAARADGYAAIAYSPSTGKWAYSNGCSCRAEAERMALRSCNACDAYICNWVRNGYAALAIGDHGWTGFAWSGESRCAAENAAQCEVRKYDCGARILCWVYSGT
jgi:serine/threonine-protein kinase